MYCSSPNTAWCQGMAVGFEKATGTKVAVVQKATGEMLAQIKAERANPKGDIWWAGPADSYLQAAENGLLETYRSPNVAQLYRLGAAHQRALELSHGRRVRRHPRARLQHRDRRRRRSCPVPKCWKDLLNPALKGEVMLGNPNSSGTAYLMLASLVQIMGEDEAFSYMVELNRNVTSYARSGIGPMTAVTRGEVYVGSTVLHGVINEIVRGFPVLPMLPCEGVGYEIGSMAIIKGARNLDAAKKFYDWALTAEAQKIGLDVKEFAIPTNRSVALPRAGAEADRHQGHRLRLRQVRRERHPQAPARSLGERSQQRGQVSAHGSLNAPRAQARPVSTRQRLLAAWLVVGAAGFVALPWYALPGSLLSTAWLAAPLSRDSAPALFQVLLHQRRMARRRGRGPGARRRSSSCPASASACRVSRSRAWARPGLHGSSFRASRSPRVRADSRGWGSAPRS